METILLIPVFSGYALALLGYILRLRRAAFAVFALASAANVVAVVMRGVTAGHLPFSNMYETMITLAACLFPLAYITRRYWKMDCEWIDPLLAAVIIFPSAFHVGRSFTPEVRLLPPALQSPFFLPHVVSYLVAYAALARAFLLTLTALLSPDQEVRRNKERVAFLNVSMGFPLLTLGLLLGAFWAKYAWGDYWSWDPKEVWSLITWFIYLMYFHTRHMKKRNIRWSTLLLGIGFAALIVTLLVVNLTPIFGGLHAYA